MMSLTARENLTLSTVRRHWRAPFQRVRAERAATAAWFTELAVVPSGAFEQPLETFSGGNQQKILLARALATDPRVLLLDEPTQGVDVGAKEQLHRQLVKAASAGAGIVISSSDTDELVTLCQRVLVLRDGRIGADLRGSDVTVRAISAASLGTDEAAA
jgi:ribose transport system ATP-binding protein